MVTIQDTSKDRDWLSDRLSTQARWFAGGVVLLLWGLIVTPPPMLSLSPVALILVGLLAVSVLFMDFCQYACGYIATTRLHREILRSPNQAVEGYDTRDWAYRARTWCFWAKQVLAVVTFAGLLAALVPALIR